MTLFTRFGQIFWGLLLVILDFRIGRYDLLPDFIGYILIAVGCGGLASLSRSFSTARILGWMLAVLSFVAFVPATELPFVFGLPQLALECALMWFLLGGVMEFATTMRRMDLAARAARRRVAYVVLTCLAALGGAVAKYSRDMASFMFITFIIVGIPLIVLILHLLYR